MFLNNLSSVNCPTIPFIQQQAPVWKTSEIYQEVARPVTELTDLFTEIFLPNVAKVLWGLNCAPAIFPTIISINFLKNGEYKNAAKFSLFAAPYFIAMGIICYPTHMTAIDTAARLTIPLMNCVYVKNLDTILSKITPLH